MKISESFNRSWLSKFLNSPAGRVFRVVMGTGFLVVGYIFRHHWLGIASMIWGAMAFYAGAFDVCFFSIVLGGPFSGKKIRSQQARYNS